MEPYTKYLMWMKSKHILTSINNSWEEQAFAEDAAGPLGGFVWPPRSYSCSFCKREFRSAQALGGHMNVHRRDRARIKQSLSPPTEILRDQSHNQSMGAQNLSPIRNILGPRYVSFPTPVSPNSTVSAKYSQENSSEYTFISPFATSLRNKECQKELLFSSSQPCFNSSGIRFLGISSSNTTYEKNTMKEDSMMLNHEANMKTKLSIGIDLVNFQNPPVGSDLDETIKYKRHKTTAVSSLPLLHKPCSSDGYVFQGEALRIKVSSMEDIDLELRLGDSQAVK